MPTIEKQPLPSTTVEMPSSRTRRSRHSAWAMAPAAAACWYRGSLCSWLQLPSGRCTQVGTVMCVCSCGSTVTVPVVGSVTGRAVRCTNSGMTSLARTASVVLVSGLYWRAQPALAWRYSAAAWTPSPWMRRMVDRVRSSPSA